MNLSNDELQAVIDFLGCPHATGAWCQLPTREQEVLQSALRKMMRENEKRLLD
jgi:hypothetical protein